MNDNLIPVLFGVVLIGMGAYLLLSSTANNKGVRIVEKEILE